MILLNILLVVFLIVLSALFSAIETAYTASSASKIRSKQNSFNSRKIKIAIKLMKMKEKVISTFLILYSAANTVATTIATSTLIYIYGEELGAIISTITMTIIIIVFAEVIPKGIAVAKGDVIALKTARLVNFLMTAVKPLNELLSYVLKGFCYILRIDLKQNLSVAQEVKEILEHHHEEGNVYKDDKDMLDGILEIKDMDVSEIMIHRSQIKSISMDNSVKEIIDEALISEYNCIPVWKENRDNIVGILNTRKLLKVLKYHDLDVSKIRIQDFCDDPWFIPENVLVSTQLSEFRIRKANIALIVDEYGDLQGMVTREDIVEEIVGQMHYKIADNIIKKTEKRYLIEGTTTIRDINRELEWNLSDEQANTIAGFIIFKLGRIPEQGEKFIISNLAITIRKKNKNQIKTVIVDIIKPFKEIEKGESEYIL